MGERGSVSPTSFRPFRCRTEKGRQVNNGGKRQKTKPKIEIGSSFTCSWMTHSSSPRERPNLSSFLPCSKQRSGRRICDRDGNGGGHTESSAPNQKRVNELAHNKFGCCFLVLACVPKSVDISSVQLATTLSPVAKPTTSRARRQVRRETSGAKVAGDSAGVRSMACRHGRNTSEAWAVISLPAHFIGKSTHCCSRNSLVLGEVHSAHMCTRELGVLKYTAVQNADFVLAR